MSDNDNDNDDAPPSYAAYLKTVMQKGILMNEPPKITTNPNLLEAQAKKSMPEKGFKYIYGSAGSAATLEASRAAFNDWRILPRVLRPTGQRDLSVKLFGHRYDVPVLMAPIGVHAWFHPDREIATVQACEALRVPYTMSTAASASIEEVAEAAPSHPKWFQLYWPTDEEITASLLKRAKDNGYQALVVTLDTWTLGWRPMDLDNAAVPFVIGEGDEVGFTDPVFIRKFAEDNDGEKPADNKIAAGLAWTNQAFPGYTRSWEDLKILKKYWDGPIVLKGVLSVEDAKLAVEHGMDGIIVSTHGGRQLDGAVGSLEVLPDIVDAVGNATTVMFDSGIRSGADIFKALAIGAKAVFVGRPVVYGLGIDGKEGAEAVLAGLLADFDLAMGFAGIKRISELNRSCLKRSRLSYL